MISSHFGPALLVMSARTAASCPPYTRSSFSSSIGRYSRMMCFIGSFALSGNLYRDGYLFAGSK